MGEVEEVLEEEEEEEDAFQSDWSEMKQGEEEEGRKGGVEEEMKEGEEEMKEGEEQKWEGEVVGLEVVVAVEELMEDQV